MARSQANHDGSPTGLEQRTTYDALRGEIVKAAKAANVEDALQKLRFLARSVDDDLDTIVDKLQETVLDADPAKHNALKAERETLADLLDDIERLAVAAENKAKTMKAKESEAWAQSLAKETDQLVTEQVAIVVEAGALMEKFRALSDRFDEMFDAVNGNNNALRAEGHEERCVRNVFHRLSGVAPQVQLPKPAACLNLQNTAWLIDKAKAAKAGGLA